MEPREILPGLFHWTAESHEVGVLCPDETALRFDVAEGEAAGLRRRLIRPL